MWRWAPARVLRGTRRERVAQRRHRAPPAVEAGQLARPDAHERHQVVAVPGAVRVALGERQAAARQGSQEAVVAQRGPSSPGERRAARSCAAACRRTARRRPSRSRLSSAIEADRANMATRHRMVRIESRQPRARRSHVGCQQAEVDPAVRGGRRRGARSDRPVRHRGRRSRRAGSSSARATSPTSSWPSRKARRRSRAAASTWPTSAPATSSARWACSSGPSATRPSRRRRRCGW